MAELVHQQGEQGGVVDQSETKPSQEEFPLPPAPTEATADVYPPLLTSGSKLNIPKPDLSPDEEWLATQVPPEPYYWEEPPTQSRSKSLWLKAYHHARFYGTKALDGAEVVGEAVADILGLTESRFQYVVDALEHEEWVKEQTAKEEAERRQMEMEARAQQSGVVMIAGSSLEQGGSINSMTE